MKTRTLTMVLVLVALTATAAEPLTNAFRKSLITQLVDFIFESVGAEDALPIARSAKERCAEIDADKNGSLSRAELSDAILNAGFRLSLNGSGLASKVVDVIDGADGIKGGQIRVNGNMMKSEEATKNLESGDWTVGKGLFKADDAPTLALGKSGKRTELTLP